MFSQKQIISATALSFLLASSSSYAADMAPQGREGKVEWVRTQKINAPAGTIDFTYSLDGKYAFFLTKNQKVQIYTHTGMLEGSIPVGSGVSRIDISPQGELLYLHNERDNSVTSLKIDFVINVDTAGSPIHGNIDAPVTIAVYTDFE